VKSPFTDVFHALSDYFGDIYARKFGKKGKMRMGIVFGEEYFFRSTSTAAILVILEEHSPTETKLQIISCAGGSGLLGLSSGAHSAYVHKVKDVLLECGFRIENEKEAPYFSRS